LLGQIEESGGKGYIVSLSRYILEGSEIADRAAFQQLLEGAVSSETEEQIMTLAERIMQEGVEQGVSQGVEQGIEQMAEQLFRKGQSLAFVSEVTGLPVDQLKSLQNRSLSEHTKQ